MVISKNKLVNLIPGKYYKYACHYSNNIFYFQFKRIEKDTLGNKIIGVDFLDTHINCPLPKGSLTKESFVCYDTDISNMKEATPEELLKYYNISVFNEYYIKTTLL